MPPVRERPVEVGDDFGRRSRPAAERWNEPDRPDEWRIAPDPARERRPAEPAAPESQDAIDRLATPPQIGAPKRRRRWIIAGIVLILLLAGAAYFGRYWYTTLRWLETTDDAYTAAD